MSASEITAAQVESGTSGKTPLESSGCLEVRNLSVNYGRVSALDNVSLCVDAGSFVSILGPSGSGKSTLLGVLAGFVAPASGSTLMGTRDITAMTPQDRDLGVVFQHYALFPHMTVEQNVAFPLHSRRTPRADIRERVDRAVALVGLTAQARRRPAQLSGGQQQRVALARALVYEPPILLLDEPLGALDRRLREQMQAELKDLHERVGSTFVYVTHDQEEALSMSDVVVVMREGRIEQQGAPRELYDQPRNAFVANFVGDCNIWRGDVRRGESGWEIVEPRTGLVLHRTTAPLGAGSREVAIRPEWISADPSIALTGHETQLSAVVSQERFVGAEVSVRCESDLGTLTRAGAATDAHQPELVLGGTWKSPHTGVAPRGLPAPGRSGLWGGAVTNVMLPRQVLHYFGGSWAPGGGVTAVASRNPADGTLVAKGAAASKEQVVDATSAVAGAWRGWAGRTLHDRSQVLAAVAASIEAHADLLANSVCCEVGKPIAEARAEVARTAEIFRYFASSAVRSTGQVHASSDSRRGDRDHPPPTRCVRAGDTLQLPAGTARLEDRCGARVRQRRDLEAVGGSGRDIATAG